MKRHERTYRNLLNPSLARLQSALFASVNGQDDFDSECSIPSNLPAFKISRPTWAAFAAFIVLVFTLSAVFRTNGATAVLEDITGSQKVEFGETVRADGVVHRTLVLADGSRVEMRAKSELSLERADDGVRIRLRNGDIIVSAAKQHGHLYVQTKDVTVSVVGTVFLVNTDAEGSRVAGIEGEVHVQHGGTEKKLHPGEQMKSNPKMESLSVMQEVAWSGQAVAHVALLKQTTSSAPTRDIGATKEGRVAFEVATIRTAVPLPAPRADARGGGGSGSQPQACNRGPNRFQLDPRRLSMKSTSLFELVSWSYGSCPELLGQMPFGHLSGGPDWVKSERWDIEALIPESADPLPTTAFGGPVIELLENRSPKIQKMLRTLVEERFKVVVRREMKETPVYVLAVAPGGPKFQGKDFEYGLMLTGPGMLQTGNTQADRQALARGGGAMTAAQGAQSVQSRTGPCIGVRRGDSGGCNVAIFANQFMDQVANSLSGGMFADRPVINHTGIQERVSFTFEWPYVRLAEGQLPQPIGIKELSKLLETVGLQLKEDLKGQVETFVIERAEKPSEN